MAMNSRTGPTLPLCAASTICIHGCEQQRLIPSLQRPDTLKCTAWGRSAPRKSQNGPLYPRSAWYLTAPVLGNRVSMTMNDFQPGVPFQGCSFRLPRDIGCRRCSFRSGESESYKYISQFPAPHRHCGLVPDESLDMTSGWYAHALSARMRRATQSSRSSHDDAL